MAPTRTPLLLALPLALLSACELVGPVAPAAAPEQHEDPGPARFDDPRTGETLLPTVAEDWQASLIHDNDGTGVWTVEAFDVFEEYATPEVVGLDDRGRVLVCVSYSGKWTPTPIIEDGRWLGGLEHGDLDPRIEGAELYTGGQNGRLFQVVAYPHGGLDYRRIAAYPGREIHTLVGGDRILAKWRDRELLARDLLHLTAFGSRRMGETIFEALTGKKGADHLHPPG